MVDSDLIGKYCSFSDSIYKITDIDDNCKLCDDDNIVPSPTLFGYNANCVNCFKKTKKFVDMENLSRNCKNISIDLIKIIDNYIPPKNKYNKNIVIRLEKKINGIGYGHNYFILDFDIFYLDIYYKLEDTTTRQHIKLKETDIDKIIINIDTLKKFNINDYVYVEYKYFHNMCYTAYDIEYKYGKIIEIINNKFKIQFNENNIAIVLESRLKKNL